MCSAVSFLFNSLCALFSSTVRLKSANCSLIGLSSSSICWRLSSCRNRCLAANCSAAFFRISSRSVSRRCAHWRLFSSRSSVACLRSSAICDSSDAICLACALRTVSISRSCRLRSFASSASSRSVSCRICREASSRICVTCFAAADRSPSICRRSPAASPSKACSRPTSFDFCRRIPMVNPIARPMTTPMNHSIIFLCLSLIIGK